MTRRPTRAPHRRRALVTVPAVVGMLAASACSTQQADETTGGFAGGDGSITVLPVDEREPAPALAGDDLDGDPLALSDFAGQTVVVNLWGSWCGPCVEEAPALVDAADELADDDVAFLGLTTRSDPVEDRQFAEQAGLPYPSIDGGDGSLELGFADSLPSVAIPTTWVIDDEGRVAARILDATTTATLVAVVEEVQGVAPGSDQPADGAR